MRTLIKYLCCLFLSVVLSMVVACHTVNTDDLTSVADDAMTVSFTLSVGKTESSRTRAGADTWADSYTSEDTDYDRLIDPASVCAYICDEAGQYVATVNYLNCYRLSADTYRYFGTLAKTEFAGRGGTTYRCVVTANTTDAADIADASESYTIGSLFDRQAEGSYYIPMWGVGTFTLDENTEAQVVEGISLLRAAVKCRVRLSADLADNYEIVGVQQTVYKPTGYVWPAYAQMVDRTGDLAYRQGSDDSRYCFRPTQDAYESGTIAFVSDPDTQDHPDSWISYLAEQVTADSEACICVLLKRSGAADATAVTYPFYIAQLADTYQDLVRGHVYNLTIEGMGAAALTLSATVAPWTEVVEELDYSETITVGGDVEWVGCNSAANKTLEVNRNSASTGTFKIQSPMGGVWYAVLDEHSYFSFVVHDEDGATTSYSTQISGTVDGTEHSIIIQSTNESADSQPQATLDFYVQIGLKFVRVEALSGWNIVLSK